jgi:hypothetical protein
MEEVDFGGWATKVGLKCTDGRTIMSGAFEHMDQMQVPLVWQHGHNNPNNVLGHALLETRDDGVYAYAFFNNTESGKTSKEFVRHGDIKHLSIYANNLVEKGKNVIHGVIREVSLVMSGANPGAKIDYINIQHADGQIDESEDEAIIHTGFEIDLSDVDDADDEDSEGEEEISHAADDPTVQDILDGMSEEEQNVVSYLVGAALESVKPAAAAEHSDKTAEGGDITHQEGAGDMSRNVFDQSANNKGDEKNTLSHEDVKGIFADAVKCGSLKEAVEAGALKHGITNIDVLFPDAKMATGTIELEKRRTEWVADVLASTRHTPFSRIKTFTADLTQDEARAKGYVKGNYKLEEWIGVTKRTTSPTTIYKKQKLDRDDMLDITDFDIVSFLKAEMRLMTEEEVARAILIGDGRSAMAEDKIKDPLGASDGTGIRSIINDHELFVTKLQVNVDDANSTYDEVVDSVMDGMEYYKGTGTPTFYTTIRELNMFLKAKDLQGRRLYEDKQKVADALGVSKIVTVEPFNEVSGLVGIIVNLADYNIGTDKGGELTMFEDFDIDYNQQKYLLETRMSGALVRPKTALIIMKTAAANVLVRPNKPAFVSTTGVVTIPTQTGVVYKGNDGTTTLTAGAQTALAAGASTTVYAVPASGYYFADNQNSTWEYTRPAA